MGTAEAEVRVQAATALEELVAVQSRTAIDLWSGMMRPLHAGTWTVETDEASLDQLPELNKRNALIFLPSHRSYADSLVLAGVLARHDLPANHVVGGSNLNFWPVGPLARRAGVVFIRRSTVIGGYSAKDFYRHRLRSFEIGPLEAAQTLMLGLRGVTSEADFERFVALGFAAWSGRSEDELAELGERLFAQQIAGRLFPEAWQLIRAHERMGHTLVLASSASRFQVEPAARAAGVEHVLCTPVEVTADGILTGRAAGPTLWRQGKADAVRSFAMANGVDLRSSYAYSNGDEDVPFLSAVGRPRAVNPGRHLLAQAREEDWPVLRFTARGWPGAAQVARTAAAYGGISPRWPPASPSACSTAATAPGSTPRRR
jgi:HAD superfamily hydrolase (TIGR01490 family)